jgi:hypothetical protein
VRRLAAAFAGHRARANEGSAIKPPKGKFVRGVSYVAAKAATHKASEYVAASLRGLRARGCDPQSDSTEGGRSEQRPYGILVQQYAIEMAHREKSKEPAPSQRTLGEFLWDSRDEPGATLREKTLGEFVRNSRKGGARAGPFGLGLLRRAQHAVPLRNLLAAMRARAEKAGASLPAGRLPHSRETRRCLIWRSAEEKIKRGGPLSLSVNRRYERRSAAYR